MISSSIPVALIPALPFVFLTEGLKVLTAYDIEQGKLPANAQLTKLFLASDVDELKEEFDSVQQMGPGTTEEWFKGLDGRGKDRRNEALKWEKWEASGGYSAARAPVKPPSPPRGTVLPAVSTAAKTLNNGLPPRPPRRFAGNVPPREVSCLSPDAYR